MMRISRGIAGVLLWSGTFAATAAQAQQATRPCVPAAEAEALVLNLAPQLIQAAATTCAPTLPGSAYLRRPVAQISGKYAAEEAKSWPLAKEALKKITGPDNAELFDSELARPMIGSMIAPMLAKEIKPADCPSIDRVLGLIDPLPARNTAQLIVTIVELASARDRKSALPICPSARTAR